MAQCRLGSIILSFSLSVLSSALFANLPHQCESNTTFNIGTGIYDITGPAAEQGMMGYSMLEQQTSGISQRLWARAFVIESPCNGKRIVLVETDLCSLFIGIKQGVIRKLQEKYGSLYSDENVLMAATHTHSGPGGYSTYALYNLSILGFSRENFNTIINGIFAAIDEAHHHMVAGQIKYAHGELHGLSHNRSPQSYLQNPAVERNRYAADTDFDMDLLRFNQANGTPKGMMNWFPLHGVSMNNKNKLISGDNKGYAEYLFEKDFHSNYKPGDFVAAFAQSNAGDVTPNPYGHEGGTGIEGLKAIEKAAVPQYLKAKELFDHASENVTGGIEYRHTFYEMGDITIDPQYTDGQVQKTCTAAIGFSLLAGTQDGEGVGKQGLTCETLKKFFPEFLCKVFTTPCQGVKPIALPTGSLKPNPWTPNILPLQIIKLGNIVIAAAPIEITTMTGRRIKETITKLLPKDKNYHVIIASLSNGYADYVATNQEYQIQRYEGASTLFGPWESAALKQEFAKLTQALFAGQPVPHGPTPPDLSGTQINIQPGVIYDQPPEGKKFGDVEKNVKPNYKIGETVEVSFWGAHPKNNFRIGSTFLAVQRFNAGQWETVKQDRDWETEYRWKRMHIASSLITVIWRISADTLPGKYRIVHYGDAKTVNGKITPYTGYSSIFVVG